MNSLLRIFLGGSREERMQHQVSRASAQLDALHTLSRNLDQAFADPDKAHELVVSSALALSGAQTAVLLTSDSDNGLLEVACAAGIMDSAMHRIARQRYDEGILGQVILTAQPWVCDAENPFMHQDPVLESLDTSNILALPLRVGDEDFGVLVVDSRLDRRPYDENDIKILEIFASFSAIVEHGTCIIQQRNQQTDRLKAVFLVSRYLSDIHEQKEFFELVVLKAVELTRAVTGSLVLFDEQADKLLIKASVGLSASQASLELNSGEGITGWVFQNGTGLLAEDVTIDNRYVCLNEDIRSEVAVPIKDAHSVIGVLNVDHTRTNAFTGADLELLQALADVASGSIRARPATE